MTWSRARLILALAAALMVAGCAYPERSITLQIGEARLEQSERGPLWGEWQTTATLQVGAVRAEVADRRGKSVWESLIAAGAWALAYLKFVP